ncbi:MAG: MFS transporter [Planctomycetes bacterium]|nr:MFS transporter [Planctomycetota bacterium]
MNTPNTTPQDYSPLNCGATSVSSEPSVSELIEKRTFRQALIVAVLMGISNGGLALNGFVALETLGGIKHKEAIATLSSALPSMAMFFAMVFNRGGVVRKRRKYWLLAGVGGFLVYAVAPLFVYSPAGWAPFLFVGLVGFSSLMNSGMAPAQNQIWAANFRTHRRAKLFSYFWSIFWLVQMTSSYFAGRFMDEGPADSSIGNFQILYPVIAVTGLVSMLMMYRIRLRHTAATQTADASGDGIFARFGKALSRSFALLKTDRNFRIYEVSFFLYGMSFMVLLPLPPLIFSEAYLNQDYTEFAKSTTSSFMAAMVLGALLTARLAVGKRITRVTATAFSLLLLYPVMLALLVYTENLYVGYGAFFLFGLAMSGVHFVWNLGPVTFAKGANAMGHTTTHTMMVGIRAVLAFPIAYIMLKMFPGTLTPIFVVAGVFMAVSIGVMLYLDRSMKRQGLNQTT